MNQNWSEKLTVLIPAYNEEATIGVLIDDIRKHCPDCKILVIDNNSTDKTFDAADKKGAKVVNEFSQGKGWAVKTGIEYLKTPLAVMMDADNTYPASCLPFMAASLEQNDVVVGARKPVSNKAMSRTNRVGNRFLTLLAELLYWHKVDDLCSGMWGFRTEVLEKFNLTSGGFTLEADLFTNACKTGCKIGHLPVDYLPRPDGSESKLKVRDGVKIAWFLIRKRL